MWVVDSKHQGIELHIYQILYLPTHPHLQLFSSLFLSTYPQVCLIITGIGTCQVSRGLLIKYASNCEKVHNIK